MGEPSVSNEDVNWYLGATQNVIEETAEFIKNTTDFAMNIVEQSKILVKKLKTTKKKDVFCFEISG